MAAPSATPANGVNLQTVPNLHAGLLLSRPAEVRPKMSKSDMLPTLTPETAIDILNKTLEELELPENVQKIDEARSAIGNEMLKMMQYMFPMVMQIQLDVLKAFGYPEGRDGPIRFAQVLRTLEKEDEEIARLHSLIKAYYLPPVEVLAANESSIEEKQ